MERYITRNTAPWTAVGTRLSQVDSTSAEVQRRLRGAATLPNGTSLRADFQTAGRGRHGRQWEGDPGENLAVSYALSAAGLPPDRLFALSQAVALAVRDAVEALTGARDACVKWPNDIYADDRKVAGLLLESTLHRERVAYVVAGVGVNVNQVDFARAPRATSLSLLSGRRHDVTEVWERLTLTLQTAHARLGGLVGRGDLYPLQRDFHAHLYGLGRLSRYASSRDASESFVAKALGVTPDGRLRLEREGEEAAYSMDEIRWERYVAVEA